MRTVYLDTNIWIELERVSTDSNDSCQAILAHVQNRIDQGCLRLPLSINHCQEMVKHGDSARRKRLWAFATRLSRCCGMVNKQSILPPLIRKAVSKVFGVESHDPPVRIFTDSGLFGIKFDGEFPLTNIALTTETGWTSFWTDMPEEMHQHLFDGLRRFEEEFVARRNELKKSWRECSHLLRKRAHIARMFLDMQDQYLEFMRALGKKREDIERLEMEDRLRLITEVPPLDVEVSLAVQHQQQWDRQEVMNDVRDISHLCMAIPYCDAVITERYWVDKVRREKIDEKYGTIVTSDLSFLLGI